jgi:hypothetical protein
LTALLPIAEDRSPKPFVTGCASIVAVDVTKTPAIESTLDKAHLARESGCGRKTWVHHRLKAIEEDRALLHLQ